MVLGDPTVLGLELNLIFTLEGSCFNAIGAQSVHTHAFA